MMFIRSVLAIWFCAFLHIQTHAQEKPAVPARAIIDCEKYPLVRLVFDNGTSQCGYYDTVNNILYDCAGNLANNKPMAVKRLLPSVCCTDTDGDGVNDEEDKCTQEKGPVNNFGCPTWGGCYFGTSYPIYFEPDKSQLSASTLVLLKRLANLMKKDRVLTISLAGYADREGNKELNMKLSTDRAKAIQKYLLKAGISENRIELHGQGYDSYFGTQRVFLSYNWEKYPQATCQELVDIFKFN